MTTRKPSAARSRLLAAASMLFYREGIHSVGVDRIIEAASVTRATFYNHFPGKEDLVQAYLQDQDDSLRALFAGAAAAVESPDQLIDAALEGIADDIARNHTRGCPFINAAAEYPDAASAVRVTVREHRDWFRATLETIIEASGKDEPAEKAASLVLLRDAALVGGYLDGVEGVREAFLRTARLALA